MSYNLRTTQGIENIVNESINSNPEVIQSLTDLITTVTPGGGQVNTVDMDLSSTGQSIKSSTSTASDIKLKGLIAGSGMSIAPSGTGDLLLTSTSGGGIVATVASTTGATGVSLKDTVASTATDIKLNTIKAGTNITLTDNNLGDITIDAAGGGVTTLTALTDVSSAGTGNLLMARTVPYTDVGTNNIGLSQNALPNLTIGSNNTSCGAGCLPNLISANNVTAYGSNCASSLTSGGQHALVGTGITVADGSSNITAVGFGATSNSGNTVVLGAQASADISSAGSIVIGRSASAISNQDQIAIGRNTLCSGIEAIAIGNAATSFDTYSIAIGRNSSSTASSAISLGSGVGNALANSLKVPSTLVNQADAAMKVLTIGSSGQVGGIADGSTNQILKTDGSGALSWSTPTVYGQVDTVASTTGSTGVSLKDTVASTATDIKLNTIKAGTNITLTDNALGDITIDAADQVKTVASTTGATGVSLKDTVASTATDIKLNTIKAGTNITLTDNALGDITIDAAGGGSSTLTGLTDVNSTLDNLLMARTTAYAGAGDNNVAVSATNPMPNLSTGNANVILGNNCLDSISTGGSNVAIGNNVNTTAASSNLIGIGNSITVPASSIIVGNSITNTSTAASSLLVGNNMAVTASSSGVTCVGHASFTPASGCVYGYACNVTGTDGHGYGKGITLSGNDSCAFGNASSVTFANSAAYGNNSVCSGVSSAAFGKTAVAFTNCVAVGTSSSASASDSVAIGTASNASQTQCVCVGRASSCNTINGVAIGFNASCQAANCISLGAAVSNIVANSLKTITSLASITPANSNGGVLVYNTGGQIGPVSGATTGQVLSYDGTKYSFTTPSSGGVSIAGVRRTASLAVTDTATNISGWLTTSPSFTSSADFTLSTSGITAVNAGTYLVSFYGSFETNVASGNDYQIDCVDQSNSHYIQVIQAAAAKNNTAGAWRIPVSGTYMAAYSASTVITPKISFIGTGGASINNMVDMKLTVQKVL